MTRFKYTPEEAAAYKHGQHAARAAAFGAIRRAAAVARHHDLRALHYRTVICGHVESGRFLNDDHLVDIESSANSVWHHTENAASIRNAIRAALKANA